LMLGEARIFMTATSVSVARQNHERMSTATSESTPSSEMLFSPCALPGASCSRPSR
jgi:hypothetical protein